MRALLPALGCSLLLACAGSPASPKQQHAGWRERFPAAAQELCAWTLQHPRASEQLTVWAAGHGDHAAELFRWTVENPGYGWEAFLAQHADWQDLAAIASQHPRAANQLLAWERRHPDAAQDLLGHEGALRFAGKRRAC